MRDAVDREPRFSIASHENWRLHEDVDARRKERVRHGGRGETGRDVQPGLRQIDVRGRQLRADDIHERMWSADETAGAGKKGPPGGARRRGGRRQSDAIVNDRLTFGSDDSPKGRVLPNDGNARPRAQILDVPEELVVVLRMLCHRYSERVLHV